MTYDRLWIYHASQVSSRLDKDRFGEVDCRNGWFRGERVKPISMVSQLLLRHVKIVYVVVGACCVPSWGGE